MDPLSEFLSFMETRNKAKRHWEDECAMNDEDMGNEAFFF
jgi:hypothetical protein